MRRLLCTKHPLRRTNTAPALSLCLGPKRQETAKQIKHEDGFSRVDGSEGLRPGQGTGDTEQGHGPHLMHTHRPPPTLCMQRGHRTGCERALRPGPPHARPRARGRAPAQPPARAPRAAPAAHDAPSREPWAAGRALRGGGGGAAHAHGPAARAERGAPRGCSHDGRGCVRSGQSRGRLRPLYPGPAAAHHPARRVLVVFGSIVNEGYLNSASEGEEFCIYNRNPNACSYGVAVGVLAFLTCLLYLALDVYFPQISSVKDRKKAVLSDIGVSAFWAFLWFVGFCYLANQWQVSKPKDNPLNEGTDAARAAIAFSFFSIFTWDYMDPSQDSSMPYAPYVEPNTGPDPAGMGGTYQQPANAFDTEPQGYQSQGY
ncbi:synaptogyrin-1 isoform X2 [Macaca mulatta]